MDCHWKLFTFSVRRLLRSKHYSKVVTEQSSTFDVCDAKNLLSEVKMPPKEGYTCLISNCRVCSKKSSGDLFVNKTTGFYMCEKCQTQGEWRGLKQLLLRAKTQITKSDLLELKSTENGIICYPKEQNIMDHVQPLNGSSKEKIKVLIQELNLPPVEPKVIEHLGVCVDSSSSSLYFPLRRTGNLITAFKVISRGENEEINSLGMNGSGLLTLHRDMSQSSAWQSKLTKTITTAVVVPYVADALALVCAEIKYHIVCLPQGVSTLPIDILPQLEQYDKIILWFGDCDGAWDSLRSFSKKLNEKRCYVVKPIDGAPNAKAAFDNGFDVVKMANEAKPLYIEAVTSFKGIRDDVLAELQNIGKVEGVKWKCFPLLNHFLKGFRRGELTVLSGSTGCGKTTFMSQYSLDLAEQGVNTLWGSFEVPNHRLARIMLTQLAGVSLSDHIDKFDHFADRLENLPIYFMKLHGEHSSNKVLKVIEHAAYVYDIGHVIIDTVQFMMGVSEDTSTMDRFWRQDNIIAGFRAFATSYNCHVTLIMHPRKERAGESLHLNSVFGGAKATQEADNVFMIQDERESSGQIFFKVLKNRYSGDLGRMPLEFMKKSSSFVQVKAVSQSWKKPDNTNEQPHYSPMYKQKQKQWW